MVVSELFPKMGDQLKPWVSHQKKSVKWMIWWSPHFRKPPCGKERPSVFKRSQLGSRTFCSSALCDCHGAQKRSLKGQPNQIHKDFDGSRPRMGLSEEKKAPQNPMSPSKLSYLGCYSGAPPILRQTRHTSNICKLERNRNVKKKNDTPNGPNA